MSVNIVRNVARNAFGNTRSATLASRHATCLRSVCAVPRPLHTQLLKSNWHAKADVRMMTDSRNSVVLTGSTLQASLKMRCDTSGAGYAIYWVKVGNEFVCAADYVPPAVHWTKVKARGSRRRAPRSDERKRRQVAEQAKSGLSNFASASENIRLAGDGNGPVATCYRSGQSVFIKNAAIAEFMVRHGFAKEFGIESICFVPFENGVLEYGLSKGAKKKAWDSEPIVPTMPKSEMREAFEHHGAQYVMFWRPGEQYFECLADYVLEEHAQALRNRRGDQRTYCSESRSCRMLVSGSGPMARAYKTGEEQFLSNPSTVPTFQRAPLAEEFGIGDIRFVPVPGGILEHGRPLEHRLSGHVLDATLKMQCDLTGANFAIYWTLVDGSFMVGGTHTPASFWEEMRKKGQNESYAELSSNVVIDPRGNGPVSTARKTGKPFYIPNTATSTVLRRREVAQQFDLCSVALVPVQGGVLEYGTTADWGPELPKRPRVPKAELANACKNDAAYVMLWVKNGDHYEVQAHWLREDYERTWMNKRGDKKNFATESRGTKLPVDGNSNVATAARSGISVTVADARTDAGLARQKLAKDFNIGELIVVPCRSGVLEYGKEARGAKIQM